MNSWIPVIGTLLGAIVAGAISMLVHWLSNRHAIHNTNLLLAEERAKWAIERRLARLESFFAAIEKLYDTTAQFRIQQAWEVSSKEDNIAPPDWVYSYDKARGEWEDQVGVVSRELLFQDEEVREEFKKADITWIRWLRSKAGESAQTLINMEDDIRKYSEWLAKRYRMQFEHRFLGIDHPSKRT